MTAIHPGTADSGLQNSPQSRAGSLIKFSDLDDLQVVVIHTGEQASWDAGIRATLQRAHNEAVATDNPIDPEIEPEQTLYVGPAQLENDPAQQGPTLPAGFEVRASRLCALMTIGRGENARQEWIPIASPVHVLAETADEQGRGYGRLLEWQNSAGRVRQWAMPVRALVPRNGEEVFAALLDAGLPFIDLSYKRKLGAYLMSCQPKRRITCVERTGWHGHAYVLPGGAIGPDAESVILQTAGYTASDFTERGTLVGWQQEVAALAVSNSRLCFALSLAFAAPLGIVAQIDTA